MTATEIKTDGQRLDEGLSGDDNHPIAEPMLIRVLRLHFQRVAKEKEVIRDNPSSKVGA